MDNLIIIEYSWPIPDEKSLKALTLRSSIVDKMVVFL